MKRFALILSLAALGCASEAPETMSKDEARAGVAKGDHAFDVCEYYGWYGDGICDDFCQYPDTEDCGPEPATCFSDDDCDSGERCNAGEVCLSPCAEDAVACPAVCAGFCVEDEPDQCWGAWVNPATGACQGPADGILPDSCCFDDATVCGGFSNTPCADDEWCDFGEAPEGAASSMTGICKPRPTSCYEIYAPVCGIDGQTYSNDCFAHSAGVDVDYEGECQEPTKICGGFAGFLCSDDEYCDFGNPPPNTGADYSGICLPRPELCTAEYDPVCGLDGQTYSNACNAHAAGVDDKHPGACP